MMDIQVFWYAEFNYNPKCNVGGRLKPEKQEKYVFLAKKRPRLTRGLNVTKSFEHVSMSTIIICDALLGVGGNYR